VQDFGVICLDTAQ